jgi:hypothetical protein
MSRPVNISDSLTFNPTGYTGESNLTPSTDTRYQPSNGYHSYSGSATTTNSARWSTSTTAGYVYYTFNISGIPENATITSVSCTAKIWINDTKRVLDTNIQLYADTTAKGSSSTFSTKSTSNTVTLNTGNSWTASEVNNIKLRFGGRRGNNTGYIYFYGADLTISYSFNDTEYEITVTNTSNATVSPSISTYVISGGSQTITFTNVQNLVELSVTDNNTNVTHLLDGSGTSYSYTIDSINEDHSIVVKNVAVYDITITSTSTNIARVVPALGNHYCGDGNNFPILFDTGQNPIGNIIVKDNGIKVSLDTNPVSTNITCIIGEYVQNESTNNYITNPENAFYGLESDTYSEMSMATNAKIVYKFDFSNIPLSATINSVSCTIKCDCTRQWTPGAYAQLYNGDTTIGSQVNLPQSSSSSWNGSYLIDVSCGLLDREDLDNLKLVITSGANSSTNYIRVYGGEIYVNCDYDSNEYIIYDIHEAHTISIEDKSSKTVTASSSFANATISPLTQQIFEDSYCDFIITAQNIHSVKLLLDNVEVTTYIQFDGTEYYYRVFDNGSNRTLSIVEQSRISVSASSQYNGANVSVSSNSIYKYDQITVTITGINSLDLITVYGNNKAITGYFENGGTNTFVATIENISENYTILVKEHIQYQITIVNNSSNVTISPIGSDSYDAGFECNIQISSNNLENAMKYLLIKDNGDKVRKNQINTDVQIYNTFAGVPSAFDNNMSTLTSSSASDGCQGSNGTGGASFTVSSGGSAYYKFDLDNFPANADVTSISCIIKIYASSKAQNTRVQLYSGSTPKGNYTSIIDSDYSGTQYNLNCGSWTGSEVRNLRLGISTNGGKGNPEIKFYGADLEIEYNYKADYYLYTIENIGAQHTVEFSDVTSLLYEKSATWGETYKIWKKINGTWTWIEDPINAIDTSKVYIKI